MKLELHPLSLFDLTWADTLVVPVDGAAAGLEGNIARQLMQREGVTHLHDLLPSPPSHPRNGRCSWARGRALHATHFRNLCLVGTLSHDQNAPHRAHVSSALYFALRGAYQGPGDGEHIACPVLSGGWRLDVVTAAYTMLDVVARFPRSPATLHVAVPAPARFAVLRDIV